MNSPFRRPLAGLFLTTLVLLSGSAYAIHCVEYLKTTDSPNSKVALEDLSSEEFASIRSGLKELPQATDKQVDGVLATGFDGLSESETKVYGLIRPREYARPAVITLKGLVEQQSTKEIPFTGNPIYGPLQYEIAYTTPKKVDRYVRLSDGAKVKAAAPLTDTHFIAATLLPEKALQAGFIKPKTRIYRLEIYSFEPSGYTVTGLFIRATSQKPKVSFLQDAKKNTYLLIDDQAFKVGISPRKKNAYLVVDGVSVPVDFEEILKAATPPAPTLPATNPTP